MLKSLQRLLTLVLCIGILGQANAIKYESNQYEALPVELDYFRGMLSNDNALLIWGTILQQNNYGFEVQRKTDNGWETIEFVQGEGTTTTPKKYKYLDKDLNPGANFYRLKIIDLSGSYEFSEVVMVKFKKKNTLEISMYPNPATNTFTITNVEGTATIYDAMGSVMKKVIINKPNQAIDVSDLNEGMYYIEIDQGEELRTTKRFYKAAQ